MKRTNKVEGWLSRVEVVKAEVDELLKAKPQEVEKLCLGGFCSKNCKSSYKFGKKVARKLHVVTTLKDEGAFEVVAERIEAVVDERPIKPTIVGLQSTFDKAWRCLGEEQVGIIGLYGMGGVGKTTLLTQINNKFLQSPNDYDVVIWVVVSKNLQLGSIQDTIGKKIGLFHESWQNKAFDEKALDIFQVLNKKKFVILLDDIWERVDLVKLGIPTPKNSSKVIFTTRKLEVCGKMDANKKFKVECLTYKEAWELFQKKVGNETLKSHPRIYELAKTVTKECGGLPLALINHWSGYGF
ncbi:hypothetical protein Patl1_34674 [Pistacia atlantica]|uniref:Uncharacterized protein n=1 Tax=Pistacia atlantica TaxID=434234 RepID=A0ACC0ZTD8_9ROSI|nr:hypothetical protein Patl1_34674 [Pistacia atlantica]